MTTTSLIMHNRHCSLLFLNHCTQQQPGTPPQGWSNSFTGSLTDIKNARREPRWRQKHFAAYQRRRVDTEADESRLAWSWEALASRATLSCRKGSKGQRWLCLASPAVCKKGKRVGWGVLRLLGCRTCWRMMAAPGSGEWSCTALITDTQIRCITHFGISINPITCVCVCVRLTVNIWLWNSVHGYKNAPVVCTFFKR